MQDGIVMIPVTFVVGLVAVVVASVIAVVVAADSV
jgi:hypothetical protein